MEIQVLAPMVGGGEGVEVLTLRPNRSRSRSGNEETPYSLGLPPRYLKWREGQAEALARVTRDSPRFHLLNAPTGAGKSLVVMALAQKIAPARVLVLTSTKGLMDQYTRDFAEMGLYDVRGAANYPCLATSPGREHAAFYGGRMASCDEGPCHYGIPCSLKASGCEYYDRVKGAGHERVVVSNYSFFLHCYFYGQGMGHWGAIVLDEAHEAPDELSGFLAAEIEEADIGDWIKWPRDRDQEEWKSWGKDAVAVLEDEIDRMGADADQGTLRRIKHTCRKLVRLCNMSGRWIWYETERGIGRTGLKTKVWKWAPLWPAPYAEPFLFRDIPRVILTSATARPKTLALLGVREGEFDTFESHHSFPVENRLVTVISGAGYVPQVKYNWSEADQDLWVARIDEVISGRLDRKGIVHTASYARAKLLQEKSHYARMMYVPWSGNTVEKVRAFKRAKGGAVLVSPAVTTGWDFPGPECRYQVIAKVPFPDSSDPVTAARQTDDRDYASYLAAVAIVQAAGRGVRSEDDWCETFVTDRQMDWFYRKNQQHFPEWFKDSVVWSYDSTPKPRRV